ncbi:hypothetical protein ERJ75_000888600 [Trypanosoma vivax]|nr:hypothetical protein ERJ75_000888600 [Trypanosoma vivax]
MRLPLACFLLRIPRPAVVACCSSRTLPRIALTVCAGEASLLSAASPIARALLSRRARKMQEDGPVRVSTRRVDGNAAPSAQPGVVGTKESRVVANAGGRPKLPVSHHRSTLHRCCAVSYAVAEVLWQLAQLSARLSAAALVGALPAFPTRTVVSLPLAACRGRHHPRDQRRGTRGASHCVPLGYASKRVPPRVAACRHTRACNARALGLSRSAATACSDVFSAARACTSAPHDPFCEVPRAWRLIGQASRPGSASSPAVPRSPTHRTGLNRHAIPRANSRSVANPVLRGGLLPSESDSDKRHRAGPTHACTSAGAKPFSPYGRLPKSTHVPSRATCLARGGLPERPRHSLSVSVRESVATARGRTQEQGRVKAQRETRAGKSDALCRTCARVSRTWVEVTRLQPSARRAITPPFARRPCVALPRASFGKGKRCCRHAPAPQCRRPELVRQSARVHCALAQAAVRGHGTRCQLGLRGRRAMWREEM